jgi:mono/diheme cytochrome c family protein
MRSRVFAAVPLMLAAALAACAQNGRPQRASSAVRYEMPANASHGRAVYDAQCAQCHGRDGTGGQIGPSLRNERLRRSPAEIRAAILDPEPPMPKLFPARMSAADAHDVTAFVETL